MRIGSWGEEGGILELSKIISDWHYLIVVVRNNWDVLASLLLRNAASTVT